MMLRVVPGGLASACAVATRGAEELGRAGVGVGESVASYANVDAAAASYPIPIY